jgi:predicted nucleotidyltransferase
MTRRDAIKEIRARIDEIRVRFGVKKLAVFGSVARDQARESSDVDVLVDFEGGVSFDRFMDLKFYLEELLGVPVDLVTRNAIRPQMRAVIEDEALDVA